MTVDLYCGDCLDVMAGMPENSVDSIITDPPYGLKFMGKDWDHGVPGEAFSKEALRVAKPGAILMAFGGTRTHHRLMVAIEDAGWILRDTIMWVYGSGFPKSHAIGKAIDKAAGAEREVVGEYIYPDGKPRNTSEHQTKRNGIYSDIKTNDEPNDRSVTAPATDLARTWDGWGTALKPAWEPVIVAMAPLDGTFAQNAEKWGVAGLWIDGARVDGPGWTKQDSESGAGFKSGKFMGYAGRGELTQPNGYRESQQGRFPANLIHDGSDEVVGLFPVREGKPGFKHSATSIYGNHTPGRSYNGNSASTWGSAARFFYCAKASRKERNAGCEGMEKSTKVWNGQGPHSSKEMKPLEQRWTTTMRNNHPTVKPLALMEYLCKLTRTPTGGVVLDPFMGSGTTGIACVNTGRDFVGIEIDEDYFKIAEARIAAAQREPQQAELPLV